MQLSEVNLVSPMVGVKPFFEFTGSFLIIIPLLEYDPFDYSKRYAKYNPGSEAGPKSRFWRMYLDEAAVCDQDMLKENRDIVDGLLIFVSRLLHMFMPYSLIKFGCKGGSLLGGLDHIHSPDHPVFAKGQQ